MYGFNQIKQNNLLVGAELLQICIGENEIILNFFPDGISITVFDVKGFLENNSFMFEPLVSVQKRIGQIGKAVHKFTVISNDTAILLMADGAEIVLKDDSSEFESVTIKCAEGVIVI